MVCQWFESMLTFIQNVTSRQHFLNQWSRFEAWSSLDKGETLA